MARIGSTYDWVKSNGMLCIEFDERNGAERQGTIYDKSGVTIVRERFKKAEREYADPLFDRAIVWLRYPNHLRIDFSGASSQILFKVKQDEAPDAVQKAVMIELLKGFIEFPNLFDEFTKKLEERGHHSGTESMRDSFVNLLFPNGLPSEGNSHG